MANRKQRRLESTVAAIQKRYGPQALQRGTRPPATLRYPHVATGFAALDAITGCQGVPRGALTLLTGQSTSGKLTLAYKTLANAQEHSRKNAPQAVALVDLSHHSDPDYLARCGVNLAGLLLVRHQPGLDVGALLVDLVRTRELQMVLLDSLTDLLADRQTAQRFNAMLGVLEHALRETSCSLLLIDETQPPWRRWSLSGVLPDRRTAVRQTAALHIDMRHERWLREAGELVGYRAQARVVRSRWRHDQPEAPVDIRFNGTVSAQPTW